jgi:hypothetical protein
MERFEYSNMPPARYFTKRKTKIALSAAYSHAHNPRGLEKEWNAAWIASGVQLCEPFDGLHFSTEVPLWIPSDPETLLMKQMRSVDKKFQDEIAKLTGGIKLGGREAVIRSERVQTFDRNKLDKLQREYKKQVDEIESMLGELQSNNEEDPKAEDAGACFPRFCLFCLT